MFTPIASNDHPLWVLFEDGHYFPFVCTNALYFHSNDRPVLRKIIRQLNAIISFGLFYDLKVVFEQFPSIRPILKHFSSQSKNIFFYFFLFSRLETFLKWSLTMGIVEWSISETTSIGSTFLTLVIGWNINALIIHHLYL